MDLNICRKCLCLSEYDKLDFDIEQDFKDDFITYRFILKGYPYNSSPVCCNFAISKKFELLNEIEDIYWHNKEKNYININKECPFYTEHFMNDINKGKR